MKNGSSLSFVGAIMMIMIFNSCDNGTTPENNDLLGYWRSETTYQSQSYTLYNIYVFETNRVCNMGITVDGLQYIKTISLDDYWRPYTKNGNVLKINYSNGDGVSIIVDIPYYFNNNNLIMTLPQSIADSMGLTNRTVTFIKIP